MALRKSQFRRMFDRKVKEKSKKVMLKRDVRLSLSILAWRSSCRSFATDTDTTSGSCDATFAQGPQAETDCASFNHDQVLSRPIRARSAISRRQQDEGRASEGALLYDDFERTSAVYAKGTRESCHDVICTFRMDLEWIRIAKNWNEELAI